MKAMILVFSLMVLVSCGKSNESGKTKTIFPQDGEAYTDSQLDLIRQDFIREGLQVLSRFDREMKDMFGPRTVGLIRGRLRHENIVLTEALIYGDRNIITRSTNRNALVTLYIGRQEAQLSWAPFHRSKTSLYTRLVMHELLLLGEIDDRDFIYTNRLLGH
jgi:hypothetical protein